LWLLCRRAMATAKGNFAQKGMVISMGIGVFLYFFFFGYYEVTCDEKQKARVLNFFLRRGISAYPTGASSWRIAHRYGKALREAQESTMGLSLGSLRGLPMYLKTYRSRIGLAVGALVSLGIVLLASRVVWRVEVSGNENIPSALIISELAEMGFGEGSSTKKTDFAALSDAYRLKHSEIAHMDIYCIGSIAYVKVIESSLQEAPTEKPPAHLVAKEDAVIESFDVLSGKPTVSVGSVVRRGELLVSGLVDGAHEDVFLHAEGKVFGRVNKELIVEIPYQQSIHTAQEVKTVGFRVNFFGKTINIFKNAGNLPPSYGTIVEEEKWFLPSGKTVPMSFAVTKAVLYRTQTVRLSESEALKLAFASLKRDVIAVVGDGYLLSKDATAIAGEESCTVKCTVTYVDNIATEQTIEVK